MISVTAFEPEHLAEMEPSAIARAELAPCDVMALAHAHARHGNAFSARDAHGRLVFCGGARAIHPRFATLWAFYACQIGPATMGALLRRTREFIGRLPYARVDAYVSPAFPAAAAWAAACGMIHEATLREAAIGGGDLLVFRRRAV